MAVAAPDRSPGSSPSPTGFMLVSVNVRSPSAAGNALSDMAGMLTEFSTEWPVVWLLDETSLEALRVDGTLESLLQANVHVLPPQGYLQQLGLLENAKCLVTDDREELIDEASSLRIPVVRLTHDLAKSAWVALSPSSQGGDAGSPTRMIKELLADSKRQLDSPAYWDSGTATRIANHLVLTLARTDETVRAKA